MKSPIQILREKHCLTQSELAQKSGLSLRTIQRIEAGSIPKGYTLRSLSKALEVLPEVLIVRQENETINRAKLINISVLSCFIIPFGNLIFPAILTLNSNDFRVRELGKKILFVQVIYTLILCTLMVVSPFIHLVFAFKIPLFISILIFMQIVNLFIVYINGNSLVKNKKLLIAFKSNII